MKITIPKPCHENWDLMTPTEKGRFCAVCTKVVRDFTECSDEEIVSEISNSSEKICGNFKTTQLNRNLNFSFVNSLFTKFAVGFMLTSAGLEKVSAQKKSNIICNDSTKISKIEGVVVGKVALKPKKDTVPNFLQGTLGMPLKIDVKHNKPLYVLDGKIISDEKFKKINPEKIKSVNVLKGNSATAIYGEKAKYGAIIIESKK